MGIDACFYIDLPFEPSEENLKTWAWDCCQALGAGNFLRYDDSPVWALTESYDDAFPRGKGIEQDGPSISAVEGHWFVEVRVCTRYYGVGYERGDFPFLYMLAEWVERNIPDARCLYGGDSGGVLAELFDKRARDALMIHFLSPRGRDYFNNRAGIVSREPFALPPRCGKCAENRGPTRYGWGPNFAAYHCPGCGKRFESRDGGKTFEEKKE